MNRLVLFFLIMITSFSAYAKLDTYNGINICVGRDTTLIVPKTGGKWSSINSSIATLGTATGTVHGTSKGSINITYIYGKKPIDTVVFEITINSMPEIKGTSLSICTGTTITLNGTPAKCEWSSENQSVGTIEKFTGVFNPIKDGQTIVTYANRGCSVAVTVTVNTTPKITNKDWKHRECIGAKTQLLTDLEGGTWTSNNSNLIIGSASGIDSGVKVGTSIIIYTAKNNCTLSDTITVNANPPAIASPNGLKVWVGKGTLQLYDTPVDGNKWSSNNIYAAKIDEIKGTVDGMQVGSSNGTAIISYTNINSCFVTTTVTVIPKADPGGFSLVGSLYSSLPYIVDDNPAGFTQTFLRANFNRAENSHTDPIHFFHSFFLEGYFSSNAGSLHTYTQDTAKTNIVSYVNKLDLYQYASVKLNLHENLLYIHSTKPIVPKSNWKTAVYFDLMESFLRTTINDSIKNLTPCITSWLVGGNLTLQFYNNTGDPAKLPMSARISGEALWINPMTNSVNPDLNFQYANRNDAPSPTNPLNNKKSLTVNPYPYFNIDAQVQFQISHQADNSSTSSTTPTPSKPPKNYLFLHMGYISNFAGSTSQNKFYNSYLTAQIGVEIDITASISNYVNTH